MTLHDQAIFWVHEKVKGLLNHKRTPGLSAYTRRNFIPDVVENHKELAHLHKIHEIETVRLTSKKLNIYPKINCTKILWIALPQGTTDAFNSIKLIEEVDQGFREFKVSKKKEELLMNAPRIANRMKVKRRELRTSGRYM